ncbi:hypothetical protein BCF44_13932 [Kutzneria buriramensis]|uniref:Secreted protein n=1 Tax=Kutzneria buriramensis TaxID=1045776 RepID=A0A3E0G589_9PSEU|nr:hypothetical protein BCF44_13932 [Kutzneria buriramensis]
MNFKTVGKRAAFFAGCFIALGGAVVAPSASASITNTCPNDSGGNLWHFQNHSGEDVTVTVSGTSLSCKIDVTAGHGNQFYLTGDHGGITFKVDITGIKTFGTWYNDMNRCFRIVDQVSTGDGIDLNQHSTGSNCNTR